MPILFTLLGVGVAHAQNMIGAEPHISPFGGRILAEWRLEYCLMFAVAGALVGFIVDWVKRSHGPVSLRALIVGVIAFSVIAALASNIVLRLL
jgi:ABC-type transport system involved in cytochrome c biogenesis permease component